METKKIESLQAQLSRSKKIIKDILGEGIWGLKKEDNKFTHEEIVFLFARIFYALGFDYVKKVRTAYSGAIRTPVPGDSGHRFHLIPDSHSIPFRTLCSV